MAKLLDAKAEAALTASIKEIVSTLSTLDCGDNSCYFAKEKKGMRTNGGCRCLNGLRPRTRQSLVHLWLNCIEVRQEE